MLYFEDFPPGDVRESPSRHLTHDEIVAFASQYDPQPFHLDDEAARRTIYGARPGNPRPAPSPSPKSSPPPASTIPSRSTSTTRPRAGRSTARGLVVEV